MPLEESAIPYLGNGQLVDAIRDRIMHSAGGALLVCGFRGAGKTTAVRRAIESLRLSGAGRSYLMISVSVAKPTSSNELLFNIIRRLFEALDDDAFLDRLPGRVRNALLLAYARTSMSLSMNRAESREVSNATGLSFEKVAGLSAKLDRSTKATRSSATEAAFLAYSEADVEHDLLRIIHLLSRSTLRSRSFWRSLLGVRDPAPHVVVVVDEIDKLTSTPSGVVCINDLLVAMKNVLSTAGLHFVFVGGTDLLEFVEEDSQKGIGVFESVFAWKTYVPCLWGGAADLLRLVSAPMSDGAALADLQGYLHYKARGIPRRLFQELNGLVEWRQGEARIDLVEADATRLGLYSEISAVLEDFLGVAPTGAGTVDDDRVRLGAYYVSDWILRTEGAVFRAADLISGPRALSPLLALSESRVERLLAHVATRGVIERLSPDVGSGTLVGGLSDLSSRFRLSDDYRRRLLTIVRTNERERVALLGTAAPMRPEPVRPHYEFPGLWGNTVVIRPHEPLPGGRLAGIGVRAPDAADPPDRAADRVDFEIPHDQRFVGGGQYELTGVLGVGGMATVYSAEQVSTGYEFAIKILHQPMDGTDRAEEFRARFQREATIAMHVDHPLIARTHAVIEDDGGRIGIVMDRVHGRPLGAVMGELTVRQTVEVTAQLLSAVGYLHRNEYGRLDVKPSNILIAEDLKPIMVDLGLAKTISKGLEEEREITLVGSIVGTPLYMAPEQFTDVPLTNQADLFSVGALLLQMLGGNLGDASHLISFMQQRLTARLPLDGLHCSDELRSVVRQATEPDLLRRFSSAEAFVDALRATPEASSAA